MTVMTVMIFVMAVALPLHHLLHAAQSDGGVAAEIRLAGRQDLRRIRVCVQQAVVVLYRLGAVQQRLLRVPASNIKI